MHFTPTTEVDAVASGGKNTDQPKSQSVTSSSNPTICTKRTLAGCMYARSCARFWLTLNAHSHRIKWMRLLRSRAVVNTFGTFDEREVATGSPFTARKAPARDDGKYAHTHAPARSRGAQYHPGRYSPACINDTHAVSRPYLPIHTARPQKLLVSRHGT